MIYIYIYNISITKNRRDPRKNPSETPQFIAARPNTYGYILIMINNPLKLHKSQSNLILPAVYLMVYITVSNAFCWSTKTPQPIFPSSRVFLISPAILIIKTGDVKYCCLNPICKLHIIFLLLRKMKNLSYIITYLSILSHLSTTFAGQTFALIMSIICINVPCFKVLSLLYFMFYKVFLCP